MSELIGKGSRRAKVDTKQSGMRAAASRAGHCNLRSVALRIFVAAGLVVALAGCMGWAPGRQAYWDAKVKEMCEKDGGVRIFEQIVVSPSQAKLLPKVGDFLAVVPEAHAKPEQPASIRIRRTRLRENNPSVVRYEQEIIRRADQRVVGVAVSYARGGGDFPVFDHPSTFWCPEPKQIHEGISRVYRIEETKK